MAQNSPGIGQDADPLVFLRWPSARAMGVYPKNKLPDFSINQNTIMIEEYVFFHCLVLLCELRRRFWSKAGLSPLVVSHPIRISVAYRLPLYHRQMWIKSIFQLTKTSLTPVFDTQPPDSFKLARIVSHQWDVE